MTIPMVDDQLPQRLLASPEAFPHETGSRQLLETHASWVLLTGEVAYKIKKPVNFGFLDYSSLTLRRHFCRLELRLNRRFAPGIYQRVVPITGTLRTPRVDGTGEILEWAVQMAQFPAGSLFSERLERGVLSGGQVLDLADRVATFHDTVASRQPPPGIGNPETVFSWTLTNMQALMTAWPGESRLSSLWGWVERQHQDLRSLMESRYQTGWVRECHGDLHLGNIVWLSHRAVPFDGIEFNAGLRWIDTANEIAFPTMEFLGAGRVDLAFAFLDRYLEHGGDFQGLALLRYYQVYRALVRAKVAMLRRPTDRSTQNQAAEHYLALAVQWTEPPITPGLIITTGLSGSGKSTLASGLLKAFGMIRLRSDVERKRLAGISHTAADTADWEAGIYSPGITRQTYARLEELADYLLRHGYPVVVDAAFLKHDQRARFRALAKRLGVGFLIVEADAPPVELKRRIDLRQAQGRDPSEATKAILEQQIRSREPLDAEERRTHLCWDSRQTIEASWLGAVRRRLFTT